MRIAVFTGSHTGPPSHADAAAAFARDLAEAGVGIVYGGGRVGMMGVIADAFVALPGAAGTLEELFEAWTWGMLGLHAKPTALLDVDGFWQPLLTQLRRMVDDGYLDAARLDALGVVSDGKGLLGVVADYRHPPRKWTAPPAP